MEERGKFLNLQFGKSPRSGLFPTKWAIRGEVCFSWDGHEMATKFFLNLRKNEKTSPVGEVFSFLRKFKKILVAISCPPQE